MCEVEQKKKKKSSATTAKSRGQNPPGGEGGIFNRFNVPQGPSRTSRDPSYHLTLSLSLTRDDVACKFTAKQ